MRSQLPVELLTFLITKVQIAAIRHLVAVYRRCTLQTQAVFITTRSQHQVIQGCGLPAKVVDATRIGDNQGRQE